MNLSRGYLLGLAALFAFLSLLLVLPFVQYILGAVLIAYILYPLQEVLEPRIGGTLSAFALLVLAIAGFVIPFFIVITMVAGDAIRILESVDPETLQLSDIETEIEEITGIEVDLVDTFADSGQEIGMMIIERSTEAFSTLTHVVVGLGLTLFLIYYLLKSGGELVSWVREIAPLPEDVQDDLYEELDDVMAAVLVGHVLIAIIEGAIAGLGLFATGIPNAAFWTFVMIILSLIPLIGAFLVWGPAVGYLLLTGEPILATALFVYSAVVVGISDDYLRPIVVDRYADLSPALIILGVLGGVYAFGIMGLFFGPVIFGALITTLEVVNDHYDRLGGEEAGT